MQEMQSVVKQKMPIILGCIEAVQGINEVKNEKIIFAIITVLLISACSSSPPKAKGTKGDWTQINDKHYYEENATTGGV